MKSIIQKLVSTALIAAILLISTQFSAAQNRGVMGELTVTNNTGGVAGEGFVTVDGQRAVTGRTIMSPADIVTPAQAGATIWLAPAGSISIEPNTRVSLSFVNSSIAGDLTEGEITIETAPETAINVFTRDGAVTVPNRSQKNTVKITTRNGSTRVTTVTGQVLFNNVLVSGGESYPTAPITAASADSSGGINPFIIVGILGAVGAAALIALSVSSNDSDNPTVSTTR